MSHTTVRIRDETRAALRALAKSEGRSMQAVLEEAVEALRRRRFLEGVNRGYAVLRADETAWDAVEADRSAWDATLEDGLAVHEPRPAKPARRKRRK
jgi:predicted transcriptional regulator